MQTQTAFAQVDQGSVTGQCRRLRRGCSQRKSDPPEHGPGIDPGDNDEGSGEYTFSPVRIGNYSLTVTAPGFSRDHPGKSKVNVEQNLQVNVQLKPGAATETVEVTTAPPLLQTEEASVGQVID